MRYGIFLLVILVCAACSIKKESNVNALEESIVLKVEKDKPTPIANWKFTKEKTTTPNEYLLKGNLLLAKHWHIFDFNPGGDGLLIAPSFNFESNEVKVILKKAIGTLITSKFVGVDENIRYYENEVRFEVLIRSKEEIIKGSIYYQLCDDEKCMAPTEEAFSL